MSLWRTLGEGMWMFWGSNYHLGFKEPSLTLPGCLVSTPPPLPSFLLCRSPFLHISTKSDRISEYLKNPLNIKVSEASPSFLFSPFFQKTEGQQALAQVGMHWHMLAHIGKREVPTQWLPSHRGLPKKLQMTALSFSASIPLSILLSYCHCLQPPPNLFVSSSFHLLSLSPAPSLLIWWRERLNSWLALENTPVTTMCAFLVCECPQRVDLSSNAKRDRWLSLLEISQGE